MKRQRMGRIAAVAVLMTAIAAAGGFWFFGGPAPQDGAEPEAPSETTPPATAEKAPETDPVTTKKPQGPPFLRFAPHDGGILAYTFSGNSKSRIDFSFLAKTTLPEAGVAPRPPEEIRLESSGDLFLKFYRASPGRWQVAGRIEHLSYRINESTPAYAESITYPFGFDFDARGYISDFRFVEGMPKSAADVVRQLLWTMQTGLPKFPKSRWRTREIDAVGRYRAEYRLDDTRSGDNILFLVKNKRAYLPVRMPSADPGLPAFERDTLIKNAQNEIRVPRKGPWILSVSHQEATASAADGKTFAQGERTLSVRITQKKPGFAFPAAFSDFLALLEDERYLRAKHRATDPELSRLGKGLDLDQALERYFRIKDTDIMNAERRSQAFLVNYLRMYPEACKELIRALDADAGRERFDPSEHLRLWRLITEAGHEEAQRAVMEAALDDRYSMLTHMRAVAYSHDFDYPEPFVAEALWERHRRIPADTEDPDERVLRNMALLAVGSIGFRDNENEDLKPVIGDQLADYLETAEGPEDIETALSAVGNYGDSRVIDHVIPFLSHEAPEIRKAAFKAFRRMADDRVVTVLTDHYEGETAPEVRVAAAKTLAEMAPSDRSVAWAREKVFQTESPREQMPLVTLLGETLKDYPENEKTLRSLLAADPDIRVKTEIYRYVKPISADTH